MSSILKIDLNGIIQNIKQYKNRMRGNQKFCAVVKADCYGLGCKKVCESIDSEVDYFAVSSKEEFLEIRRVVTKPILILDPIYENITMLAKKNCEFCVSNFFQLESIYKLAIKNKKIKYKIHLAINTGMNRFGFSSLTEVMNAIRLVQKTQNIFIIGVFSHFYLGNNMIVAKMQSNKLESIKRILSSKIDVSKIIFHIANTDGFENETGFDMVRIGLGMFLKYNKQNFTLTSKIIEIQNLKTNDTAGYGLKFIATKITKVAIVSIGYADGIFCSIVGRGYVLINGKEAKILSVCMDSIIVDITCINAKLCDEVVLIGKSGDKQIFVCDFASWCDTIEYEIMTRISKRVKRVYIGGKSNADNNRKIQSKKTCGG